LAFYEKVSPIFADRKELIPPPTFCPDCRQQRRITYRNERKFYKRKCDLTGEPIVSIYPEDFPGKVYGIEAWYGDGWDPLATGRDFDFSRGFFEQFLELAVEAPRLCLLNMSSENSVYTNHSAYNKNCYMCINTAYCEDMFYCTNYNLYNKSCADCLAISHCEMCYFCTNVRKSQFCSYLYECEQCTECHFCYDCKSCENCFGCWNLRHKKYHIFNEPYSEAEYKEKIKELRPRTWEEYRQTFNEWKKTKAENAIHKALYMLNCINSSGNHLENCKNVKDSYYVFESEDCRYNYDSGKMKDCYDVTEPFNEQMHYEVHGSFNAYHNLFCSKCLESKNTIYSQYCIHCNDCFACFGLHRHRYCIFNKQYSQEEYEELVPRIIEYMRKTGEWGEFFPSKDSAFGYNETIAQEYYLMNKEEVLAKAWKWRDEEAVSRAQAGQADRAFKIIPQELKFYRRMGLPEPKQHPDVRHMERMGLRNPRHLRKTVCGKCGVDIETTYAEGSVENIYCEKCYERALY
jgi:hypothetical protein